MKKYLSAGLRIIVAIIFLQTLYFKFTAHPDSVFIFSALGVEPWGRISLGIVELVTSVLILLPATKLIGMLSGFGIISGAIISHLFVLGINVTGDHGKLFLLAITVFAASLLLLTIHRQELILLYNKSKK